ncbi:hypothetical protein [Enterococcus sp. BWR-S5]|uniref:hypothetical protein n=1 Tax=Enterococcus sp. BWR-S5 TaxID=2787714 RepID=UPI00192046C9|nr:hypothetical protein [Enterococcus sp. BWR-S5]MBL1227235.1 hypothetical protein [Enterococcus sp. BWR-S5]
MENILFDSEDFHEFDSISYEYSFVVNLLKIDKRYTGGFIAISEISSHYGSICGNGLKGYKFFRKFSDLLEITRDRLIIKETENHELTLEFIDHDKIQTVKLFQLKSKERQELEEENHFEIIDRFKNKTALQVA